MDSVDIRRLFLSFVWWSQISTTWGQKHCDKLWVTSLRRSSCLNCFMRSYPCFESRFLRLILTRFIWDRIAQSEDRAITRGLSAARCLYIADSYRSLYFAEYLIFRRDATVSPIMRNFLRSEADTSRKEKSTRITCPCFANVPIYWYMYQHVRPSMPSSFTKKKTGNKNPTNAT